MRFGKRTLGALGAALAVSAAFMSACGGSDEQPSAERAKPTLASTTVIDKDPDAIACGHVRDQLKWDRETRRATVAIANREKFKDLNLLQATQSVFYAMTEVCKGRPASFEPAAAAIRGVRDGTYAADLGTP